MHFSEIVQAVVLFSIVLGIMVLVHELGHFLVAKACGVRIEAFSIGMGPRLFGFVHNGTDYKICALPIGGFVKMAGEYGNDTLNPAGPAASAPRPGDFTAQPRSNRILIALAGPFSNFVLSFLLLTLVAHYHNEVDQYLSGPAVVDYVPLHSPAAHDGLAAGDTIVRFNDVENPTWNQILTEAQLNLNRTVPFSFTHNGRTVSSSLPVSTGDDGTDLTPDSMTAMGLLPREQTGPVGVQSITANSPAERAGLQPGDQVARIDSLDIHSGYTLLAYLKDANGAPANLVILRQGRPIHLAVVPEKMEVAGAATQYRIGFGPVQPPVNVNRLPLGAAIRQSLKDNHDDSKLIFRVLGGLFTRHVSGKRMTGRGGIAKDTSIASRWGSGRC